jgi:hypothetical protein
MEFLNSEAVPQIRPTPHDLPHVLEHEGELPAREHVENPEEKARREEIEWRCAQLRRGPTPGKPARYERKKLDPRAKKNWNDDPMVRPRQTAMAGITATLWSSVCHHVNLGSMIRACGKYAEDALPRVYGWMDRSAHVRKQSPQINHPLTQWPSAWLTRGEEAGGNNARYR